ncbi:MULTISPECIES: hypothetical protein [Gilliamella]|uniref:hypothetical protein n=1 Tax=Gilliamella TaxID=1193503 RepID=UPI0018DD4DDD|nr:MULTISPECIES: hypothetical protein [unclassified Gilliamella]MBI0029353.1 hypothetical protein [Gilliamella sp. B14448G7]MBI0036312.1 hypothetical protein [Gilliamella sp. B14448G11]MBI0043497.1 hypothetical protein [Gilliamella sp. B14448G12]
MRFGVLSIRARIPKKEVLLSFGSYFDISLQQITNIIEINALQPLNNNNKYETVKQVCRLINEIMYYAVNMEIIDDDLLANITYLSHIQKSKIF